MKNHCCANEKINYVQFAVWSGYFLLHNLNDPSTISQSSVSCTSLRQGLVGRQAGEPACWVAGQEILWRLVCCRFHIYVHPNPNGGKSDGVKHSASAWGEDWDPGEQRHRQSGKKCKEIKSDQELWWEKYFQWWKNSLHSLHTNRISIKRWAISIFFKFS